ncbi:MAG: RtcB family protein [Bacilli bacterium]|nr:RtcB family protein [Bacilli bacterium]
MESAALTQIDTLIETGIFENSKIRIMPDVHQGEGCVIGLTAALKDKVIPNIVGVDIGCGVLVAEMSDIKIDFMMLDNFIRRNIPFGFSVNKSFGNPWEKSLAVNIRNMIYQQLYCLEYLNNPERLVYSCGSLGGGNHFIEIGVDQQQNKYLMIHSGSRNLGYQVAAYYQQLAIKTCKKIVPEENLPDDLCYLVDENKNRYLHDMLICQQFAVLNRLIIKKRISEFLNIDIEKLKTFASVHNYIGNDNIIRKGAISARKGEKLVIPINMKDGCIIGLGKGAADWNYSAPHGAGRILSRRQAKRLLDLRAFKEEMDGIYTTCISHDNLDEAPMAYKPIEEIMDRIHDSVAIETVIKPVYNFKA